MQKLLPPASLDSVERIDVFRRAECGDLPEKVRCVSVPHVLRFSKILSEFLRMSQILACGYRYDVFVGCFQQWHGIWAYLAGKIWQKPVIQLVITDPNWNLKRFWCRKAMLSAAVCGVRGEVSKKKLLGAGYKGRIEIIHNPLEQDGICAYAEEEDVSDKKFDIIASANYADEKGYEWMMNVLAELKKELPEFRTVLCGAGLEERLKTTAESLKLSENIVFTGNLSEKALAGYLGSAKCFISTSHTEGLPQALIEAMAFALPCVVTDAGDIPDIVENGTNGYIVRYGETDEMKDCLLKVLKDETRRAELSEGALRYFEKLKNEMSIGKIAEKWRTLFGRLLRRRNGRADIQT